MIQPDARVNHAVMPLRKYKVLHALCTMVATQMGVVRMFLVARWFNIDIRYQILNTGYFILCAFIYAQEINKLFFFIYEVKFQYTSRVG